MGNSCEVAWLGRYEKLLSSTTAVTLCPEIDFVNKSQPDCLPFKKGKGVFTAA